MGLLIQMYLARGLPFGRPPAKYLLGCFANGGQRQIWISPFLTSQMVLQNIREFYHFCMSTRIVSARSGSCHFGHDRWLSEPYRAKMCFARRASSDSELCATRARAKPLRAECLMRRAYSEDACRSTGAERKRIVCNSRAPNHYERSV